MSEVDTPSPHSSRKQKKCGSCHSFLAELDPHLNYSKCVPRGCSRESPCSHWAPSLRTHGRNGSASTPLCPRRGPRGIQLRGGGTNLGRYAQMFLQPPKPNLPVSSLGTPHGVPPPDSKTGGSRLQEGGPSRAAGCDLSEPSRVMGPSGYTAVTRLRPWTHGLQWSVSSTDITLTAKQGAALTSSYGSDGMGEVSTGTASTAFTGQRSQPTDATRQLFIVDDMAVTGHPSHSAAVHGDTAGQPNWGMIEP